MDPKHIDYTPASFFRRFAAFFYDSFIVFSIWIFATALALLINRGESFLPHQTLFLAYLFAVTGLFLCFFWHKKGQTLGMLAWKIIVLDEQDRALSWRHAIKRYLFAWLSIFTLGLGFIWCLWDSKKQTLHDRLAKTKVLSLKSSNKPHTQAKK